MSYTDYHKYYHSQCGGELPVYRGAHYQRGHGLGSLLKGAMRTVSATLLPAAKSLAKGVASDVLSGKGVLDSVKDRALDAGRNVGHSLLDSALQKLDNRPAIKRRATGGSGRPRKARKVSRRKKQKGRGVDIFG